MIDFKFLHELGYCHKDFHSGPSNKSDNKICGLLPYILNGEPYTLFSDIYTLEICNGLRPEFGKGTPEIYKKLAYKCMNAIPADQRPEAIELFNIFNFWLVSIDGNRQEEKDKYGYKGKEIKVMFKEADEEIPNISTSYEMNPEAIYTSRPFTLSIYQNQ
ncbi:kinase-like domain-containing protein [Rhizophagus clarus]|uniref:Kinase-like domain-containing protein n=1 Tax=Rhizophagus clarus TaxID=94130 RepID=A0A8H3L842_9GLOM|nr:kinase-like domain-containing protein [Rhizophagus clarus]